MNLCRAIYLQEESSFDLEKCKVIAKLCRKRRGRVRRLNSKDDDGEESGFDGDELLKVDQEVEKASS